MFSAIRRKPRGLVRGTAHATNVRSSSASLPIERRRAAASHRCADTGCPLPSATFQLSCVFVGSKAVGQLSARVNANRQLDGEAVVRVGGPWRLRNQKSDRILWRHRPNDDASMSALPCNDIRAAYLEAKRLAQEVARTAIVDGVIDAPMADMFSNISAAIDTSFWVVMILVAASDGPISKSEADYMNFVFGKTVNSFGYNTHMLSMAKRNGAKQNLGNVIDLNIKLNQHYRFSLDEYDPVHDPLVKVFERIGEGLLACDAVTGAVEAERLAEFTAIAKRKALQGRDRAKKLVAAPPADRRERRPTPRTAGKGTGRTIAEDTFAQTPIDECVAELRALVGLSSVKKEVETLINLAKVFALRREKGMPVPPVSYHLVFAGNPGTGKTTVARIVAKVYGSLGLLSGGGLVEVDRFGLVANYVGQTATKTTAVLDPAMGGVLFIDEAYSLSKGGDNDFGSEAIEVILKRMEGQPQRSRCHRRGIQREHAGFSPVQPRAALEIPARHRVPELHGGRDGDHLRAIGSRQRL